ncbi:bifunctional folylpolyglutamate synthase/dihydrofolate synthase [Virgibacillus siamensis]|uniref:bifunctional folylpolyglutamate synthase/dihydrofolate synthase n=1 Tax=Virgibacillus siamensis TaxID=480071 RepID=UPI0009878DC7|nr:folylpolyglutamate synthase/dihydrofolate synthase family protein [Virgibacillus siamensis]
MFSNFAQVEDFFNSRKLYGMKPGLDRIHKLLQMLGNPQDKINAVHVAGTNGKGSTVYYLRNALIANGYSVGVFTSPSLEGITGHILKNDKMLQQSEWIAILNRMLPCISELDHDANHPTEFEIITAAAFLYFADNVEIALIEAGMGGREDTTNCFSPLLSVITNVEKDHIAFLGNTKTSIAYHKAGIIKKDKPVIVGEMETGALNVIREEAAERDAPVYHLSHEFQYSLPIQSEISQSFEWTLGDRGLLLRVTLNMHGIHQVKNASLAIMVLRLLRKRGYVLDWNRCLDALYQTVIPGRFERIGPSLILDGAHNPAGVNAFIKTLGNDQTETKHLIFAAFRDKDLEKMLRLLCDRFSTVTLTSFDHPRAASCDELMAAAPDSNKNIKVIRDWKEAIQLIPENSSSSLCWYVTGSLNFIDEVRKYIHFRREQEEQRNG